MRVKSGSEDDAKWEGGDNHRLRVPSNGATAVSVLLEWGGELEVEVSGGAAQAPGAASSGYSSGGESSSGRARSGGSRSGSRSGSGSDSDSDGGALVGSFASATSSWDDSMALRPQWQGKQLRFMQSNEHTRWAGGGGAGVVLRGCIGPVAAGDACWQAANAGWRAP